MTYYSIVSTENGYVAAWPTKGEIYFARLDQNGELLAPGEIRTPGRNGMRTGLIAIPGKNGSVVVAWNDGSRLGWQLYDDRGFPVGKEGRNERKGKGATGVALASGDFVLF